MWTIIKKYYLFPFVGFIILFAVKTIGVKSPNTPQENFLIILLGALLLSTIIGTIYYFLDTKWGPKKREKRFFKTPFKQLLEGGFRREDDFITGTVNGYTIIVMYVWPGGKSAINIDVLFDPRFLHGFLSAEDIRQIEKRNKKSSFWTNHNYLWTLNSVGLSLEYTLTPPSAEKVITRAKELVDILIKEGLKPITLKQSEEVTKIDRQTKEQSFS